VLLPLWPIFLSYVLSFAYVGIYWNNHHHMLHECKTVTGGILWANLHLLFWLSLIPFTTGFMGENHFASLPTALYGAVLFITGFAYLILQRAIIRSQGKNSPLKAAVGNDWKGKLSAVFYLIATASAFWIEALSFAIYVIVALMWLVPDRRIERHLKTQH
jgi:TMEM175 potassium channel family protein